MNHITGHLSQMRQDYHLDALEERDAGDNPVLFFEKWLAEALSSTELEPNSMTICTVGKDMMPSARTVLLKGIDEGGFVFFTNYNSRKGHQIAENNKASILFFWKSLQRQVRIEGIIERCTYEYSKQYFHSRPKGSQIGAVASPQSQIISSREWLERKVRELTITFQNEYQIPMIDHWGGYKLIPSYFEFWQGRESRLHDRLIFELTDMHEWKLSRIAP